MASRINPNIRDTMVMLLTLARVFNKFIVLHG
jgi:hypothetical protein